MARWQVRGASRQTGADVMTVVDAGTEEQAISEATARGVMVETVVEEDEGPSVPYQPRTPARTSIPRMPPRSYPWLTVGAFVCGCFALLCLIGGGLGLIALVVNVFRQNVPLVVHLAQLWVVLGVILAGGVSAAISGACSALSDIARRTCGS